MTTANGTHPWELAENVVMAASAGTGKTYNLVGVLLYAMLLGSHSGAPIEPARILATTFSKRAAEEVRERVVGELSLVAEGSRASSYGTLFGDRNARQRAKDLSQRIHELRITTLHAFAVEVLREHGMHVAIAPDFTLLDAQEEFLRLESTTSDTVEFFARHRSADLLTAITAAGGLGELVSFLTTSLREGPERAREVSKVVPNDDAPVLAARFEDVIAAAVALSTDSTRFATAAKELLLAWNAGAPAASLEAALAALFEVRVSSKKTPSEEAWAELVLDLPGDSKAAKAHILFESYMRRGDFGKTGALFLELLAHAEARMMDRARARQELSFSDVLVFARLLLRDHPEVAYEIGGAFDACLIDEAQDTSPLQRDIVTLLWQSPKRRREPGEDSSIADIRERGFFVVGDRKQSIYGFRGADVAIFAEFALGIAGAAARTALGIPPGLLWEPAQAKGRFLTLRENYRGNGPLLAAANHLSRGIFVPSQPSETFDVHYVSGEDDLSLPEAKRDLPAPLARVGWLGLAAPADEDDAVEREFFLSLTGPRRDAEIIARKIAAMRSNVPLREMAVLARSNAMLDHVAFALAQKSIPYVASGRAFFAAREVQDAAALLQLVHDPTHTLAAAQVLRGPYTGLSDLTLLELTGDRGLLPILDVEAERISDSAERARFIATQACVRRLSSLADRLAPAELLREGIRSLQIEHVLKALRNGDQRVSNLRKLEQWLGKFRHLHTACLRIEAARSMAEAEAPTFSDADDAVRLLTIHGSKGLSFPIVFLPELAKRTSPVSPGAAVFVDDTSLGVRLRSSRGHWLESPRTKGATRRELLKKRADAQRVWYVAITRAEREMYFAGGDDKAPPAGSLLELLPGLIDAGLATREDLHFVAPEILEKKSEREAAGVLAKSPLPRTLALAPTALADFVYCPRRFALANVWRVPEGRPLFALDSTPVDPRAKGTAMHKVLEHVDASAFGRSESEARHAAETTYANLFPEESTDAKTEVIERVSTFLSSNYARSIAHENATVLREVAFRMSAAGGDDRDVVAALRGTIDALVRFPDGSVDVLDYKSGGGPSLEPYSVQLRIYARAAREIFPDAKLVRAFAVFLGGDAEPRQLEAQAFTDDEWIAAVSRLARAQAKMTFPRVEIERCRALRCGYVPRCHGDDA